MDTLDLELDEVIGGIARVPVLKLPVRPKVLPKSVRGAGGALQQLKVDKGVKLIGNRGAFDDPPLEP